MLPLAQEILVEQQPVPGTEGGLVHHAVAHQLADQLAPDQVVLVQLQAARHRQAAGVQCGVVADQVARVLAVTIADAADRADAETDNVAVAMRRITLEISLQCAGALRPGQLVIEAGEMIHADVDVAGGAQLLQRATKQC